MDAHRIHLLNAGVADQARGQDERVLVVGFEDDGWSTIEEAKAAVGGCRLLELAIRNTSDGAADGDRATMQIVSLAADRERDARAAPGGSALGDGLRIAQRLQ